MKELTDAQKGYIAGIIDGEGCLIIRHQNNQRSYYAVLQVCNTDINMISWLIETTGVGLIAPFKHKQPNRKNGYKWTVFKKEELYTLLDAIRPYLVTKSPRADVLYKLRELKNQPLVRKNVQRGRLLTSDTVVAGCKVLFEKMRELNFRGCLANGVNSVDIQNGQYRAKPTSDVVGRCDGQA